MRVYSNCEEVGLYLNGKLVEKRHPDNSRTTTNLKHPPFTFHLARFEPGTLRAVGYINGRKVAACELSTPGESSALTLQFDTSGKLFAADGKDMIFCRANMNDQTGTLVSKASEPVFFGVTGPAQMIGDNPISAEAGIATILLGSDVATPHCIVYAMTMIQDADQIRILSAAASPDGGHVPDYKIHYTTDGSEPTGKSPEYSRPVKGVTQLRAAIFVEGRIVVRANWPASAPSTGFARANGG